MPVGLRGLMMAVMIAALMSDLDSIFNSASTIFTLDIYQTARKGASQKELLVVGRMFVVFMVAISIAWVPVIIEMQGGQMYLYIQEVAGYLTPPIAALFLLGVFWKRCNEKGAFWGGMTGLTLGTLRLVLAFIYREPPCDKPDDRPLFITHVHYMYFAAGLFWISGSVAMVVSLCTCPPDQEQVLTTTIWGLRRMLKAPRKGLEEAHSLTDKHQGNGSLHKDLPADVRNDRCLDGADVQLLVPSTDHDPATPSTETTPITTPSEPTDNRKLDRAEEGRQAIRKRSTYRLFLDCFCGYKDGAPNAEKLTKEDERTIEEMLYEPPWIKAILNVGLVCVCSLGVFMFVYFSL